MPIFRDHIGREVSMEVYPPQRIVSLVPSQTEWLYDLGLDDQVVGITKFCVHPEHWFRNKPRIGGTKNPKIERILELKPDLVIANKEENRPEDIAELEKYIPVWVSDVKDFESALDMMHQTGVITNRLEKAKQWIQRAQNAAEQLHTSPLKRALYLIWRNPYMTVGTDTYISQMLPYFGYVNALKNVERYPEITASEMVELKPEVILLSSEPFPFSEKHIEELQRDLPGIEIKIVDGEKHSWYGSRLVRTLESLSSSPE